MRADRYAFAVLLLVLACTRCGSRAHAQEHDDALDLARLCVHEAGFDSPDDCTGIYAVIANGAEREGMTWSAFARVYSRRFFAGTSAQPWALQLDEDRGPHGVRWSWTHPRVGGLPSRHDAFSALVAHCRVLFGGGPSVDATDWGSESDMRRRASQGRRFRVVAVGASHNVFSVRRGLDRRAP